MTIESDIVAVHEARGQCDMLALWAALPQHKQASVQATVSAMVKKGLLARPTRTVTRLPKNNPHASEKAEQSAKAPPATKGVQVLRPCPWCLSTNVFVSLRACAVTCEDCGATGPRPKDAHVSEMAATAWNVRG